MLVVAVPDAVPDPPHTVDPLVLPLVQGHRLDRRDVHPEGPVDPRAVDADQDLLILTVAGLSAAFGILRRR